MDATASSSRREREGIISCLWQHSAIAFRLRRFFIGLRHGLLSSGRAWRIGGRNFAQERNSRSGISSRLRGDRDSLPTVASACRAVGGRALVPGPALRVFTSGSIRWGLASRGSQLRGGANRSYRMARVAGPGGRRMCGRAGSGAQPRKALIVQPVARTEAERAFLGTFWVLTGAVRTLATGREGVRTSQGTQNFITLVVARQIVHESIP
jgi:hypothetical protein